MIDWEKRKEELFDLWFHERSRTFDDMLDKIIEQEKEQEKEMIRELFQKLIIHCENHHGVMLNISTKHLETDINKLLSEYKIEEI